PRTHFRCGWLSLKLSIGTSSSRLNKELSINLCINPTKVVRCNCNCMPSPGYFSTLIFLQIWNQINIVSVDLSMRDCITINLYGYRARLSTKLKNTKLNAVRMIRDYELVCMMFQSNRMAMI